MTKSEKIDSFIDEIYNAKHLFKRNDELTEDRENTLSELVDFLKIEMKKEIRKEVEN